MSGRLINSLVLATLIVVLPSAAFAAKARSPVAMARTELSMAKSQASQSRLKAQNLTLKVKKKYEARADWKQAADALGKAKVEYNAASRPVIAAARGGAQYKSIQAREQQGRESLATVRVAAFHAGSKKFTGGGRDVKRDQTLLKQLEADAIASDPTSRAAKQKLDACHAKVNALQAELDAELAADANWVAAKQAADAAQQRVASANSAYASAVAAEKRERNAARPQTIRTASLASILGIKPPPCKSCR